MADFDVGTIVGHLQVDDTGLTEGLKGALGKLKGFGGDATKIAKGAGVAIAAGLAASLTAAVNAEPARKKIAAQLRLTDAEVKRVNESANKLFKGNYAEDIGEANDVIRAVIGNFKDMRNASTEDLTAISQKASLVADLMGEDFEQVTRVAGQLVRDGLAKNATEAFDLITAASQNTTSDMQGDLLEVASEYSKHFANLGITGSEALELISEASQSGAIQMDKVGDSLKELSIRATDMSTASVDAYNAIGLDAETMAGKIAQGGETARGGLDQIVDGLLAMEDPVARANAAIGLFGTPLEDLSVDQIPAFLQSLKDMDGGLGDTAGRTKEAAETMRGSVAGNFSAMWKDVQASAIEVGENLLPLLKPVVDALGNIVGAVSDVASWFSKLPDSVTIGLAAFGGVLILGPKIISMFRSIKAEAALAAAGTGKFSGALGKLGRLAAGGGILAGLTIGISYFIDQQQKAAQYVAEFESKVEELVPTLGRATGALTAMSQAQLVQSLIMYDKAFGQLGVSVGEAAAAMIAGGPELEALQAKMGRAAEQSDANAQAWLVAAGAMGTVTSSGENAAHVFEQIAEAAAKADGSIDGDKLVDAFEDAEESGSSAEEALKDLGITGQRADKILGAMGDQLIEAGDGSHYLTQEAADAATETASMRDAVDGAVTSLDGASDAVAKFGDESDDAAPKIDHSREMTSNLGLAAQEAADAQSELSDATNEILIQLDKLAGRAPDAEQAMSDLNQATDDMAEKFGVGTDEVTKLHDAIGKNGKIKTGTQAQRDFRDSTLDTREALVRAAQAAYDKKAATGDLEGAERAAQKVIQHGLADWEANATKILGSKGAADDYRKSIGLVPKNIVSTIKLRDQASSTLDHIKTTMTELNGRTIWTTVNTRTNETVFRTTKDVGRGGAMPGMLHGGILGFAGGGMIPGVPPNRFADDRWGLLDNREPIRVQSGEFVVNRDATLRHRGLLEDINSGAIKAFASGGLPGAFALSGRERRSPGTREGNVRGALGEISEWVRDLRDVLSDARGDLRDSKQEYTAAMRERNKEAAEQARAVAEARAERRKGIAEANRDLTRAQAERDKTLNKARNDIESAKGFSERAEALREYAKADRETMRDVHAARDALTKAQREGTAEVRAATVEQAKANRESAKKVAAAKAEYQADLRRTKAAQARASEAEDDMRRTRRARSLLVSLGREIDRTNNQLSKQKDRLADLRGARADMRTNLRGSIAGFDSGVLGHSEQRRTAADIIRGLQYNNRQVAEFSADLTRAKRLGLSASLLEQIASAGVDGGGITANALAGASRAQIEKINQLSRQVANSADRGARAVSGATYNADIREQTQALKRMAAKLDRLEYNENTLARAIRQVFKTATPRDVLVMVKAAERAAGRR